MSQHQPLAELVRGELVESIHYGTLAVLAADGNVAHAFGEIDAQMYPRSASKLMQAAGMVELGLDLPPQLLALVASSHSGGDLHEAGVREILSKFDQPVEALRCLSLYPLGSEERRHYRLGGGQPATIRSDCSGKHAGFIATCVINGWSINDYNNPDHPLQRALAATVAKLTGVEITYTTVDGCGAPLWSTTTRGLANAFRAGAIGDPANAVRKVADAMRAHPEMVGGNGREATEAMRALPGVVAKDGADGVFAMADAQGRAAAFKISDGSKRALTPVIKTVLTAWGADSAALDPLPVTPVLGGGKPVGYLRTAPAVEAELLS